MNKVLTDAQLIEKVSAPVNGTFTTSDLKILLKPKQGDNFRRRLNALLDASILRRFSRGIYVTQGFSLNVVSQKIAPNSYISLANVLAESFIIGTRPHQAVTAVKVGKKRKYSSEMGQILHLGVAPHLFFGFSSQNGVRWADNEKAFLDTLYFYQRGQRFFFDIYSDIDVSKLSIQKLNTYLERYRNEKFKTFVKGYLRENLTAQ